MTNCSAIGYVLTHHPRDSQTFIQAEIDALRDRGHPVSVWAMNQPGSNDLTTEAARVEHQSTSYLKSNRSRTASRAALRLFRRNRGALVSSFRLATATSGADPRRWARAISHWLDALVIWDQAASAGVEHLHAHFGQTPSTLTMVVGQISQRAGVGPSVWTATVHGPSEVVNPAEARMAEKARAARVIVAVSEFTRSQILPWIDPQDADRVRVVRCGIDLDRFEGESGSDRSGIVFVGRVTQAKGIWTLLEAMRHLKEAGIDLPLTVIGDGDLMAEAQGRGRDFGIDVTFVGSKSSAEVAEYLERAAVFCLPSYDEGLPVAIMEAMASGAAVVTTPVGGIPELAIDGQTALLVAPDEPEELARALARLTTDTELRQRLVVQASAAVAASHDASQTLPAFIRTIGASGC